MKTTTFWIGVVLGFLGIALPVIGVPRWAAFAFLAACGLIAAALLGGLVRRRFAFGRRTRLDDADVPPRDDCCDLADELDGFAGRLDDWLDARALQAPSIIESTTTSICGKSALAELLHIFQEDPARWNAHQQAVLHFGRTTRAAYVSAGARRPWRCSTARSTWASSHSRRASGCRSPAMFSSAHCPTSFAS